MKKLYKITKPDLTSFYDESFQYNPPGEVTKLFDKHAPLDDEIGPGLYLSGSIADAFWYAEFPARVFEAEPVGDSVCAGDKTKCNQVRLLKDVTPAFVHDVNEFISSLIEIDWLKDKKSNVSLHGVEVFSTRDTVRSVTLDAAGGGAWNAAGLAASGAALGASRAAAGDAKRRSAGVAAARRVPGDASWDAALFARCLIALDRRTKHFKHAQKRMDLWRAGYGVLCDVDGVIYAYERI